jgi:hypothetical protein
MALLASRNGDTADHHAASPPVDRTSGRASREPGMPQARTLRSSIGTARLENRDSTSHPTTSGGHRCVPAAIWHRRLRAADRERHYRRHLCCRVVLCDGFPRCSADRLAVLDLSVGRRRALPREPATKDYAARRTLRGRATSGSAVGRGVQGHGSSINHRHIRSPEPRPGCAGCSCGSRRTSWARESRQAARASIALEGADDAGLDLLRRGDQVSARCQSGSSEAEEQGDAGNRGCWRWSAH